MMKELKEFLAEASAVKPEKRQLDWFNMEMYIFCHFTVNTFTDKEWGDGTEDEKIFNPTNLDCDQWVAAAKAGGFKGIVLTAKHHDGFCLWPSKYTEHSVKNSSYKGDVVRELSDACRRGGIKFGFYLSPWDRNSKYYGTDEYNDYFCNQLTELLTEYGDIFCVWFERDHSGKQNYDWERYYSTIRKYQPNAMICNCGPDIRWCGNHKGVGRTSEWSVVPKSLTNDASPESLVQPDLGSRKKIKKADELVWFPMVMDLTMRPGWFFHDTDTPNMNVLSKAIETYFKSVGNNGTFLLDVAPSHSGKIERADLEQLVTIGAQLELEFKENFTDGCEFVAN